MTCHCFVDTHCHLNFEQFAADREEVIRRAETAGVIAFINPAVDLRTSREARTLAHRFPSVFALAGVHPNSATEVNAAGLAELRVALTDAKVVAVGEIGLDYHWNVHPAEVQAAAFRAQLELAAEEGVPVVIHSRQAPEETYTILAAWAREVERSNLPLATRPFKGVWHSFQGDRTLAYRVLDLGFCISLGGPVTFKNARELRALVPHIPLDRLLLETDAPFLSPHPYRGQRNEPARLPLIAAAIAQLHGVTVAEVAHITTATACRVFGKGFATYVQHRLAEQGEEAGQTMSL